MCVPHNLVGMSKIIQWAAVFHKSERWRCQQGRKVTRMCILISSAISFVMGAARLLIINGFHCPDTPTKYRKSGSMFFSSELVATRSDCSRLRNALCLCSPVRPAQAEQESCPKAWPLILPSKPPITFWKSLRRDCQMTGRGSNLDSKEESELADQRVVKVL